VRTGIPTIVACRNIAISLTVISKRSGSRNVVKGSNPYHAVLDHHSRRRANHFMAAMTMPCQVKDASILEETSPGNQIKAETVVGNHGAYLENIVVTTPADAPEK
jgi:Cu/Ag efflux protein CusF